MINALKNIGIDVEVGLKYCGDMDFYKEILEISVNVATEKLKNIKDYYDVKDYKGYTIVVHSIKSSAANIGAMEISRLAKKLEDAGKSGDYSYIDDNAEEFEIKYQTLIDGISRILDIKTETVDYIECENISIEQWNEMLRKMSYYLAELELDMAEELLDKMLSCKVSKNSRNILMEMKNKLQFFDVEGVKEKMELLVDEKELM